MIFIGMREMIVEAAKRGDWPPGHSTGRSPPEDCEGRVRHVWLEDDEMTAEQKETLRRRMIRKIRWCGRCGWVGIETTMEYNMPRYIWIAGQVYHVWSEALDELDKERGIKA